jgi:hypothetical protein
MTAKQGGHQQLETWNRLYGRLREQLQKFGTEGGERDTDCWIEEDNWGYWQHKVYIDHLKMLRPQVVESLRAVLKDFPDWEIMMAVSVPGPGERWPHMGITIRAHEIIDGLQRQYFPPEFQDIQYEGSRRGTDAD